MICWLLSSDNSSSFSLISSFIWEFCSNTLSIEFNFVNTSCFSLSELLYLLSSSWMRIFILLITSKLIFSSILFRCSFSENNSTILVLYSFWISLNVTLSLLISLFILWKKSSFLEGDRDSELVDIDNSCESKKVVRRFKAANSRS